MKNIWKTTDRWSIAKNTLTEVLDSLKDRNDLEFALRVYGHQRSFPPQDCDDTKLEINFIPSNIFSERIRGKLSMIKAKGTTPIAKSLEEAAADFPTDNSRNIVILITDGKEECGMDPCAVSRLFAKKGIILKPFVIGIGLDKSWQDNLDCVGTFFDAANERDFSNILTPSLLAAFASKLVTPIGSACPSPGINIPPKIFLSLITGITVTSYTIVDKYAVSLVNPFFVFSISSFLGGFLSITLIDKRINHFYLIAKNNLRIIFTISFFSAVAYTLVLFAYKYSEVSLVTPLREVQTAIAAIMGIVLLKEELRLYKIIGVSLIVVGAVLITY